MQAFKQLWFNSGNPNGANNIVTMENYFKFCSYGKTRLSDVSALPDCPLRNVFMTRPQIPTCSQPFCEQIIFLTCSNTATTP